MNDDSRCSHGGTSVVTFVAVVVAAVAVLLDNVFTSNILVAACCSSLQCLMALLAISQLSRTLARLTVQHESLMTALKVEAAITTAKICKTIENHDLYRPTNNNSSSNNGSNTITIDNQHQQQLIFHTPTN